MKIRDGSQGWKAAVKYNKTDKSPWGTHEEAMAKKTAIRALSKYLPLSVEFMDAVQVDNDAGSRVDYAGFAMKPEDGATIDGEFIESREQAETEDKGEELVDHGKAEKELKVVENRVLDAAPEEHRKTFETIEQDLLDGAPTGATAKFHAEAIEKMKAEAPELHAELMTKLQDTEAAG